MRVTNEEPDLEEVRDKSREVVDGGVGAPGVLVEVVLVTEERMERIVSEHKVREG